jgi:NAD(P)-dependent dehydrogenase (short-subunit alcohol dehydrogenase family)
MAAGPDADAADNHPKQNQMTDMTDRVALITGASSGIGKATAEAFAARGAKVVVAARRQDELAELVAAIEAQGGTASAIQTDVSKSHDVERMVNHAMEMYGRLDFAVNNAGIEGKIVGLVDMAEEDWDTVLDINLKGIFLCMKHEAKAMLGTGNGGAIVNVGSILSFLGIPGAAHYVASKHGMIGLTTSASAELAPHGIRVNIVCPGAIETPMHHRGRANGANEFYDRLINTRVHIRRVGRSEEIAPSILFLCSDEASYITGTTLTPDGGLTLTV